LTLAVAQVLCGFNGEHRWIRHIRASDEWRAMLPYIPNQPAYNKRLRGAQGLLRSVIRVLAEVSPSWFDDLWITDATPVPCGMSRETAKRGVSPATVQRIWSARGLKPHLVETFKLSNDPQFEGKLVDVVGLYLNPPENAVVLCMDE